MNNRKFKNSEKEKIFFTTLREKVYDELKDEAFKFGKTNFWLKGFFWSTFSYGAYCLLFLSETKLSFWGYFLIFQLAGLLIGFSLGHDASHNTAFRSKKKTKFFIFLVF